MEDFKRVTIEKKPYFIGSVILKTKPTGERVVIDGQQRLTTISILLKAVSLLNDDLESFNSIFRLNKFNNFATVISHSYNDKKDYERVMNLEIRDSFEKNEVEKNRILGAYHYFAERLREGDIDFNAVCTYITFVNISLHYEEDEQQIFEALNSIGVKLETSDLIKNHLFSDREIDSYFKNWYDIFEKDDEKEYWEIEIPKMKRPSIDVFLHSFLQIKQGGSKAPKIEELFSKYKEFIESDFYGDKSKLVSEIKVYSEIFRNKINPQILSETIPAVASVERINLIIFKMEVTAFIPYILFIEHSLRDFPEQKKDLYEYLETYIMRCLITKKTSNLGVPTVQGFISNNILSKGAFKAHIEGKTIRMPENEDLKDSFTDNYFNTSTSIGILYMIESKLHDEYNSTSLLSMNTYTLEHIMPKKWHDHWNTQKNIGFREDKIKTLGNLTMVTKPLNASMKNADWNTKKKGNNRVASKGLEECSKGIKTMSSFLQLDIWDEDAILNRSEWLYKHALKIWKI